jgi:AraC-like DNA-binding protein
MDLDADIGPADALVFGVANSGSVGFRTGQAEHWHAAGDPYLAAQPGRPRTAMVRGRDHDQVIIDSALIARVARGAPGRIGEPPQFTGFHPISPQAAQVWKSTCDYVRNTALAIPGSGAYPLVSANAGRLLAATALAVFPNSMLTEPTSQDRHDAHTGALRRAVAFIDEHAREDITVADIASAAFVTIRAVQLAFRRHLDTTPMGYLRQVRLGRAHHDLKTSAPGRDTVTAVAYRWGFSNPSHFGGLYRQAYGTTPSQTLRTD